jgi:hypothetical protein
MSNHIPAARIEAKARIVSAPAARPVRNNRGARVFDIHPGVHLITIGAYAAFAGILLAAFTAPAMIVPAAIVVISIAALFLTPALWAGVVPGDGLRKQSWAEFMHEGVECLTGKLTAGQALAQILTLPLLVVGLALAMAIIKASI